MDHIIYHAFSGVAFSPVDLAAKTLAGDYRDYIFFNSSQYVSVLIIADHLEWIDSDTVSLDNADMCVFTANPSSASSGLTTSYFYSISRNHDNFIVDGVSSACVYSSEPLYPHLREGVDHYAFFLCAFCVGVSCWVLCDRIFRRLY